jgi:Protein of unknown function (DUF3313)
MKIPPISIIAVLSIATSACTTVPTVSDGFLSRNDRLEAAKGLRGKRLATPAPTPPLALNTPLCVEPVQFSTGAVVSTQISPAERALIENVLARNACKDFSKHFDILSPDAVSVSAYHLRMAITRLEATNKLGAAIGVATNIALPIGVRPPIGLGALTVEFELVAPNGDQAAAMVWSKRADMVAADAATSRIGDAYIFASDATRDFESLASKQTSNSNGRSIIPNPFDKADAACDIYGQGANRAAQAVGFLGLPLPPENVDKGPKPQ